MAEKKEEVRGAKIGKPHRRGGYRKGEETTSTTATRPSFETPTAYVRESIEEDGTGFPACPLHKKRRVAGSHCGGGNTDSRLQNRNLGHGSGPGPQRRVWETILVQAAPQSVPSMPTVSHHLCRKRV